MRMSSRTPLAMQLRILAAMARQTTRLHYTTSPATLRAMLIAERADAWVFKARVSA